MAEKIIIIKKSPKETVFKANFDRCMKQKDGYLWLLIDLKSKEFLGFDKKMLN